jgi:DNA polymerase-4
MLDSIRTILHLDLDAFYCTVEEQRDPSLHGQPFAVGARPEQRGVVASCSYAARRFGVRSAMPMSQAVRLCPQLLIVPSRHAVYQDVSLQVMAHLHALTPLIEQISIDEAFLDVTSLVIPHQEATSARVIARHLQRQIKQELGLSCSLGVASNKMMAKIANDYGKSQITSGHSPQAICVVPFGEEAAFLAPLPVSALWGVGPKTEARLKGLNLHTIGQLAGYPLKELVRRFGSHGYDLFQHARGIDKRAIETSREAKSISSETTFVDDVEEWEALEAVLREQADDVAVHLHRKSLQGDTIKIKVRWADFTTPTRQKTLPQATDQAAVIAEAALELLRQLWAPSQRVRLLGVGVAGLTTVRQLSLWDEPETRKESGNRDTQPFDAQSLVLTEDDSKAVEENTTESMAIPVIMPDKAVDDESEGGGHEWVHKQRQVQRAIIELQERYGPNIIRLGPVHAKISE